MGVAVVALGYALYTQFKPGKTASGGAGALSPILNGQIGTSYNPMQGAPYDQNTALGSFGLAGLLSGTTNDWSPAITGNGGKDSIYVKGWWN
ncbi:MAG: hypothetical protein RR376_03435 [Janthinobacterium sp.]